MEIKPLDFFIGLILGVALGVGGTMLVSRIRGWLGRSEVGRLRAENRVLSRRLAEKDRHIGTMLAETQRLAERLGKKNVDELSRKGDEILTTDH
jgi:3-dehydroquinate synthase class II